RTRFFMNVFFKIFTKIFQCALKWLHGPRCKCAECISGPEIFCMKLKQLQIFHSTVTFINCFQNFLYPWQSLPTRCTKSAGLLCEEVLEVLDESDRARLII